MSQPQFNFLCLKNSVLPALEGLEPSDRRCSEFISQSSWSGSFISTTELVGFSLDKSLGRSLLPSNCGLNLTQSLKSRCSSSISISISSESSRTSQSLESYTSIVLAFAKRSSLRNGFEFKRCYFLFDSRVVEPVFVESACMLVCISLIIFVVFLGRNLLRSSSSN